jgi:hypothetical protein
LKNNLVPAEFCSFQWHPLGLSERTASIGVRSDKPSAVAAAAQSATDRRKPYALSWQFPMDRLVTELWVRYFPAWQSRHVPYVPP